MMIGSVRYEVTVTTEVRWQWLTPRGDHKSEMMMGDLQEVKKLECVVFFSKPALEWLMCTPQ